MIELQLFFYNLHNISQTIHYIQKSNLLQLLAF
nr:MAG TPA: hypothetical protein [Caudoviricetes sp.]